MKPELKWTEEPPTKAGWYWRRDRMGGGALIQYVHRCNLPMLTWEERKEETLICADTKDVPALEALPDSSWIIEWAGPIPVPTPENEDSLVRQTVNLIKSS